MIRMYFGLILDHYACIDYGEKITVICYLSVQKLRLIQKAYLSHVKRKPVFGVFNQLRLELQTLAKVLKFWIEKLEILYLLGSEQ